MLRTVQTVLFTLLLTASSLSAQGSSAESDITRLSAAGNARAIGPDTARVTLIEFFDYACPTCQAFHRQRGDSLHRALAPDVRFVPLTLLIPHLLRGFHAAEAATCAAAIGGPTGYRNVSRQLFARSAEWTEALDPGPVFKRIAVEARVDSVEFNACRDRDMTVPLIMSDLSAARTFGVEGTPTFLALPRGAQGPDDAERISGNVSIAELLAMIDKARARAK